MEVNNRILDPRIPQAKMLVESMIMRRDYPACECMIFNDGILMVVLYNTAIYMTSLICIESGDNLAFYYSDIGEDYSVIPSYFLSEKLSALRMKYDVSNRNQLLYIENISDMEWFENYKNIKTANGCQMVKVFDPNSNIYYMPMFSSFPAIKTKDKLSIAIYNDMDGYYTIKYILYKHKIGRIMTIQIRCLNINQSLTDHYKSMIQEE